MLDYKRQQTITELLKQHTSLTTTALSSMLYVSEATIRRDLTLLEKSGLIRRVHGGAVIISGPESEIPLPVRDRTNDLAKQNIAAKAIGFVNDGDTVILDASSTVARIIPLLKSKKNLTVITNSPKATLELAALHIRTLVTGGVVLENSLAFVGRQAEAFIASINADVVFFSCRGVSEDGDITDSSLEEASIRREMLRRAKKKYLLCDRSKLNCRYTYNICSEKEIDGIITERSIGTAEK